MVVVLEVALVVGVVTTVRNGKYGKHVAISTLILFSIGIALRSLNTNEKRKPG